MGETKNSIKYTVLLLIVISLISVRCTNGVVDNNDNVSEAISLFGKLVDGTTGEPAENASVFLYNVAVKSLSRISLDDTVASVLTNIEGEYVFDSVDTGRYYINAVKIKMKDTIYANIDSIIFNTNHDLGVDTLKGPGGIRGKIISHGYELDGVLCNIPGTSYNAVTDKEGMFKISSVPPGKYSLNYVHIFGIFNDTTVYNIKVFCDSITEAPPMILYINTNQIERSVMGFFTDTAYDIKNIKSILAGDNIPDSCPRIFNMGWNSVHQAYSGFIFTPRKGSFWDLTVCIYDTLDHKIGQRSYAFDKNTGDILIPAFFSHNAVPVPHPGNDTIVSANDTVFLYGTAVDSFGGTITKWEWKTGESNEFVETGTSDTFYVVPALPDSLYQCFLRVTDDDGNKAESMMNITIDPDIPVPTVRALQEAVAQVSSFTLVGNAQDKFGYITKWEWDIGNTGIFIETDDSTYTATAPDSAQNLKCILRVTDDDNNTATALCSIYVMHDIDENLIIYYPFNGNAEDESGNDNHGVPVDATLTQDRFGNDSSAYALNGNTSQIEFPSVVDYTTPQWTFSVWFTLNTLPSESDDSDLFTYKDWTRFDVWGSNIITDDDPDDVVLLFVDNVDDMIKISPADYGKISTNVRVNKNEWYHAAAVVDSNSIKIYVNGVHKATFNNGFTQSYDDSRPFTISGSTHPIHGKGNYGRVDGTVDDMFLYLRALNEHEIQRLFQSKKGLY